MRTSLLLAGLIGLLLARPALAGEDTITLEDGQGREVVEQNCAACHSLDYIVMNSPFLDRVKWEATVKKMIGTYGAPIAAEDADTIVGYLAAHYGKP
ncbi:cytochrome c [Benzoatithermus flavus]|uniref:Cytochrome c domain-containing protein n=1 Tax=Benzoatithermus flavus TaxID=3108223 RepID=A0ABU8XY83_9PROT